MRVNLRGERKTWEPCPRCLMKHHTESYVNNVSCTFSEITFKKVGRRLLQQGQWALPNQKWHGIQDTSLSVSHTRPHLHNTHMHTRVRQSHPLMLIWISFLIHVWYVSLPPSSPLVHHYFCSFPSLFNHSNSLFPSVSSPSTPFQANVSGPSSIGCYS